jgi:hypothetical protein
MESTTLKLVDHILDLKDSHRPQLRSSSKLSVSGSDMSGFAPQLDVSPAVLACSNCDRSVVKACRSAKKTKVDTRRFRIIKGDKIFDIQRRVGTLQLCGINAVANCLNMHITISMMNTAIDDACKLNVTRYKPGAVIPRGIHNFGSCTIFEMQCLLKPLDCWWQEWKQCMTFERIVEYCMTGMFVVYGWNGNDKNVPAHYLAIREGYVITDYVYKGSGGAGAIEPLDAGILGKFLFGANTRLRVFCVMKK